jgi:very-short-patch-repair endonuclease
MPPRNRTATARRLRRQATDAEQRLWYALRDRCRPWKFRRQHPVGRRVVDFACPARKLAIEIDGGQHAFEQEADAARSVELARHGYRVIRFWNNEVLGNIDGVLLVVLRELEAAPTSPRPSPPRGAERETANAARIKAVPPRIARRPAE